MNRTNPDNWFARCRLAYLERKAQVQGHISRRDITTAFGISFAQASSDLQTYLQQNPDSLNYDLSVKRYHWNPKARIIYPAPWEQLDL